MTLGDADTGNSPQERSAGAAEAGTAVGESTWSTKVRWFASGFVVFHFIGVLAGPLNFAASEGGSPAVNPLFNTWRFYTDGLYLNHGYFFFAPNPGSSRLVKFTVEPNEGEKFETTIPDKEEIWPRLLYHRHFMLTEYLGNMHVIPQVDEEFMTPQLRDNLNYRIDLLHRMRRSYQQHVRHRYDARYVELECIEHFPASLEEVMEEGVPLDDERFFRSVPVARRITEPADPANPGERDDLALPPSEPNGDRELLDEVLGTDKSTTESTTESSATSPDAIDNLLDGTQQDKQLGDSTDADDS